MLVVAVVATMLVMSPTAAAKPGPEPANGTHPRARRNGEGHHTVVKRRVACRLALHTMFVPGAWEDELQQVAPKRMHEA